MAAMARGAMVQLRSSSTSLGAGGLLCRAPPTIPLAGGRVKMGVGARPALFCSVAVGDGEAEFSLATKKCTPCSSKELRPMTIESAKGLLEQIPGWDLLEVNGQLQLQKSWKAKNFTKGLEFIKSIADVAESEGHHPDLHLVNWNDVKANIWTHSIGGLSENDFILAAKISTLSGEGFLRKSLTKSAPKPPTVAI